MNNNTKLHRIALTALLAAAFAGSGLTTIGTALNAAPGLRAWLAALLSALLGGLAAYSTAGAVIGLAALAVTTGGWTLTHLDRLRAVPALMDAAPGAEAVAGAQALLVCAALVFGALFFLMLYRRGGTSMAILILGAMLVFSHGMSQQASIAASVPGLIAGAAAFALSDGVQRDRLALRVLLPSALAVAVALVLMPAGRVTWPPMEDLAARVRSVFEQYFNFTHERIAFSIAEEGYNHGGEVDGQPVAMLGGPANPDPKAVMRVTSDAPILLRGTIRATYTGYSWVDVTPKNRYLYYDVTHRLVRERVFDLRFDSPEEAFQTVRASVELLDSGTSTLFVPGRMKDFDMALSNAVYYNSSGEMFMARVAERGDSYALEALNPVHGEALMQAVLWGETDDDDRYGPILSAHSQLPDGIEDGLYALTMEITADARNPYERAAAIADYLRKNMRYKLEVEYPPRGRDFVSWFVLDSRQGYCSYYASAMAVMGRIAGLPTRYVEGYYARPGADGAATLTGMDAHAWAEVYFKGLGWIPFDATNGGPNAGGEAGAGNDPGEEQYGYAANSPEDQPGNTVPPEDDPSKAADGVDDGQAGLNDNTQQESTPSPEPEGHPFDEPEDDPQDDDTPDPDDFPPEDQPEDRPEAAAGGGAWGALIVLLILALIALLIWWVRRRLQSADPALLCKKTRRASQGAMIAYRANLTLLAHMGQYPQSGESPEAFAQRVAKELDNPDFEAFSRAVTLARYAGKPVRRDDVQTGLRAYARFEKGMRPMERARFILTRVIRGLGDFDIIP